MHIAEVAHLGDPRELLRADFPEGRKHRCEGHVHPYVDGPEGLLDQLRRRLDLGELGNVGGNYQGMPTEELHLLQSTLQARLPPRHEADTISPPAKPTRDGAADPGAR